ncbi:NADH-quinone oxidoreductase subunit J [candidate division KSB1 bacterium]
MEYLFFYAFGIIAIASGVMVIMSRNPVHSALFLIVTFFCLAGLFALLNAHFLAVIQVLVYAGAIMVLFLFVLMLLNLKAIVSEFEKLLSLKILGISAAIIMIFEVLFLIKRGASLGAGGELTQQIINQEGNTQLVGKMLFTTYLLPFEITSIILIIAIIGAVVLAKKKLDE